MAPTNQPGRSAGAQRGAGSRPATRAASASKRLIDYPRAGKGGIHRWLPSWRLVLGSVLVLGFLVLGLLVAAYATEKIPKASDLAQAQTTTVYYANNADGSPGPAMGTFATQDRQILDPKVIPQTTKDAVVASEDSSFYQNSGVDPVGIARALVNNLRGGAQQGASTITEQYVENYYSSKKTKSYVGKLKEALLAVKISQSEDKDRVLGTYLNTIYFGRSAYGIQAAAQAYFGVDAKNLTVTQSALLAGIIPSPSNWDPAVGPAMAKQRWTRVLDRMVKDGKLKAADRATQVFPPTIAVVKSDTYRGPQGYLLKLVRDELIANHFKDSDIDQRGLSIVTTIQKPLQDAAVASVDALRSGKLSHGSKPDPNMKVAVISIDPKDGGIVALYGGPDYVTSPRNAVTQDEAQAGSTFKPFALVAGLENGISLDKTYSGASPQTLKGWDSASHQVKNFGSGRGENFGQIDLVEATAQSVNTVYAQLNLEVTPAKTVDVAKRAGGFARTNLTANPANVLGTDPVHPIDMADAYATFAAQGYHSTPFIVRTATYLDGSGVAYQGDGKRQQVFKPNVMADATYAMTQVVQDPLGTGAKWIKPLGRPIAGKTGTSTDNKSAWFVGYTPQIATAVAFYQPSVAPAVGQDTITHWGGEPQITGGTWPSAMWASYMKQAFKLPQYSPVMQFPKRSYANRALVTAKSTPVASATAVPTATATSAAPTAATVPGGLVGSTQGDAEAAIVNAGLKAGVTSAVSATVPKGRVVSASPAAGASVVPGSTVAIVVSLGTGATPVPASTTP